MGLLTAADFDTANVIANIALAGGAILVIVLAKYGWKKIVSFFGS